jgi:hypothetical protein
MERSGPPTSTKVDLIDESSSAGTHLKSGRVGSVRMGITSYTLAAEPISPSR